MHIFTPQSNFSKVSRILLSLLTVLILQTGFAFAQDAPFITVWKTDNPGSSEDNQITIPGTGTDYLIEWEEVDNEDNNNGSETGTDEHTITFPSAGTYRVKISGDFTRIEFNNEGDKEKILDIEQWGDIAWSDFSNAFYGCTILNYIGTDEPNLSNVTNMSGMFAGATSFNAEIGGWDVSNITYMGALFLNATLFNQDISDWDVSNVTDMFWMFNEASSFNRNIGTWDVSNVVYMSGMFRGASSFNGSIGTWNVMNVKNMDSMFKGASSFNSDISNWNVSNVTDMSEMFERASSFNRNIGTWDVSNVENMNSMFYGATSFNQDIGNWNVANVNDMISMFYEASAFDQNLGEWDLTNINNLNEFLSFSGLSIANYDLSLAGWATNGKILTNITLGATGLNYCESVEYREQLINDFAWNIILDQICSLTLEESFPTAEATLVEKDTEIYLKFDREIEQIDFTAITLKDVTGVEIEISDIYIDSLKLHLNHNGLESNTYEVIVPYNSISSKENPDITNETISLSFTTQRILSSKEQQKPIDHSAFPNPFSDFTTIQFNLPQTQSVNLLVFDLKGQIVRKEQYDNFGSEKQSIRFERKDLPAGLYRYQIQSKGDSVGGKLLIE